jgi:2-polyprenyl-3-methyl-5-hydroxy-6-metoxy-1,4-benzoquinol methylase
MTRDLSIRNRQPEAMDSPSIPDDVLIRTLDGLSLVNAVTLSLRIVWPDVRATVARHPDRPVRILDVAAGGGDMLIRLHKRARRQGVPLELAGCDISPVAIAHARAGAEATGAPIAFFRHDAARDPLPDGYDMIMSSLFLHHLDDDDAVRFLREAAARARDRVLIHDLARSRPAFWFARLGTSFLLLNDICRKDGERSVEGAFTRGEAAALAERAGLAGAEVTTRLPFRFLLRWVRPGVVGS